MQAAVLASLIPMAMWGTSDYLSARASRKYGTFLINFIFALFSLPLPLALCILWGFPVFSALLFAKFFLASFFLALGFSSMVRGFSKGVVGLVAPVVNANAIVTMLVTFVLFHETFHLLRLPALIAIVISIMYITYKNDATSAEQSNYSVRWGVLGMIFFGIGTALMAHFSRETTWYGGQLIMALGSIIAAHLLLSAEQNRLVATDFMTLLSNPVVVLGGLMASVGGLGFFWAISLHGSAVLVATVASAAPVVTSFYAFAFDHEVLTHKQRVGAVAVLLSVLYLNMVS